MEYQWPELVTLATPRVIQFLVAARTMFRNFLLLQRTLPLGMKWLRTTILCFRQGKRLDCRVSLSLSSNNSACKWTVPEEGETLRSVTVKVARSSESPLQVKKKNLPKSLIATKKMKSDCRVVFFCDVWTDMSMVLLRSPFVFSLKFALTDSLPEKQTYIVRNAWQMIINIQF